MTYTVEELREMAKLGETFRPGHTRGDIATAYAAELDRRAEGVTDEAVEHAAITFIREFGAEHVSLSLYRVQRALRQVLADAQPVAAEPAQDKCFCDRTYPDSNPDASCGDCPTRDYKAAEPAQPDDSGHHWSDEEKAHAFEWLRTVATAEKAPVEAGIALDTWHALAMAALAAQGQGDAAASYREQLRHLESRKCPVCHGSGKCDDLEPGDISYQEWECTSCNGSGLTHPAHAASPAGVPDGEVILEHSGCGYGVQCNQLGVKLYPGDKVLMVRGPLGKAMTYIAGAPTQWLT